MDTRIWVIYLMIFLGCFFQLYVGYFSKQIRKHRVDNRKSIWFILTTVGNAVLLSAILTFIGIEKFDLTLAGKTGSEFIQVMSKAFVYGAAFNSPFKEMWKVIFKR